MVKFLESCPPRETCSIHNPSSCTQMLRRFQVVPRKGFWEQSFTIPWIKLLCTHAARFLNPQWTNGFQRKPIWANWNSWQPRSFATWEHRLQKRPVLLWIDNDSAASSLVKGYSPQLDSAPIVGDFWLMISQLQSSVYIDRVESKSNLADGPSRNSFESLKFLGASWTPPKTGTLGDLHFTPPAWNGAPTAGGEEWHQIPLSAAGGELTAREVLSSRVRQAYG